jgi:hypothetical protein
MIPPNAIQSDLGYSEAALDLYIKEKNYHLALDELTGVIDENPSPGRGYWKHLIDATQKIGLVEEERRCRMLMNVCHKPRWKLW